MKYKYNNRETKVLRRNLRKDSTDAEQYLWSKIRGKQINNCRFLRQYSVGRYIIDFYCPKKRLGIELDGGQHGEINKIIQDEKKNQLF